MVLRRFQARLANQHAGFARESVITSISVKDRAVTNPARVGATAALWPKSLRAAVTFTQGVDRALSARLMKRFAHSFRGHYIFRVAC